MPTIARAGMGEKGGLSTYQPVVTKSRQSFYKTVSSRGASVKTRCQGDGGGDYQYGNDKDGDDGGDDDDDNYGDDHD